jgi:diguanylate cyclase (GGDEF)-like protein
LKPTTTDLDAPQGSGPFPADGPRISAAAAAAASLPSPERLGVVLERLDEGIVLVDAEGRVEHLNALAGRWLGLDRDGAIGTRWAGRTSASRDSIRLLTVAATCGADCRAPCDGACGATAAPPREIEMRESFLVGDDGRLEGRVVRLCDVTERHRLQRELEHLASHDEITGLPNRRAFERALADAVDDARARDARHTLVYLDLDEFKLVNDTCGHAAGDELLRRLAGHLGDALAQRLGLPDLDDETPPWLLARLGGDEFGVLLRDADVDVAQAQAEALHEDVHDFRFAWGEQTFRVGASIGITAIDRQCGGVDALLQATDGACYMAKDAGRNRIQVHDFADPELARRYGAMQWVSRIESALDEDRFCLYAQAIEPLQGPSPGLHFEVLLRLRDEEGGLASPGAFMPAVERYHLSARIDEWVITNTLHWLAQRAPGEVSHCAINLSAHTVGDPEMLARIETLLDTWPVPAGVLCFEITETAAIGHLAQAERFIRSLRARGCQVALDDFGVGMSSFAYLRQLPVDVLKIDGLFVRNVEQDEVNQAMLRAIRDIARVMGLRTVAEFAETEATLDWLRDLGLDHAQGYAISQPLPIDLLLQ